MNIQYPMSNVQYPSGSGVWCQHDCLGFERLNGAMQALAINKCADDKHPNHLDIRHWILDINSVLTPNTRPTWTLDIGHWILDIL
jgi:hypothetical protein